MPLDDKAFAAELDDLPTEDEFEKDSVIHFTASNNMEADEIFGHIKSILNKYGAEILNTRHKTLLGDHWITIQAVKLPLKAANEIMRLNRTLGKRSVEVYT